MTYNLSVIFLAFAMADGTAEVARQQDVPTADDVVARMMTRDRERQATLHGYTATRRYVLENRSHHMRAEMLVHMLCREDGSKQFEVVSSTGWAGAWKYVFSRLLEAETEASNPDVREQSRITSQNYTFKMAGPEYVRGRNTYVIAIEPKRSNKFLSRGRIWVDAEEYAIMRIEGKPAKNPSFWTKSVHFIRDYHKIGDFWFPVSDRSVTDARIFGATEMTIEYFDYVSNDSSLSTNGAGTQ